MTTAPVKSGRSKSTRANNAPSRIRPRKRREGAFSRDEWLTAARNALIKGGIDQVKVERLSKQVNVARSSFYWYFRSREDLLDALLDHWEATNTGPLLRAIDAAIADGPRGITRVTQLWIEEREFSPTYDAAVRSWARENAKAAGVLRTVDNKRMAAFVRLMEAYGHKGDEALVRARIVYFHQVGYYTLDIHETVAERMRLAPFYIDALIGRQA